MKITLTFPDDIDHVEIPMVFINGHFEMFMTPFAGHLVDGSQIDMSDAKLMWDGEEVSIAEAARNELFSEPFRCPECNQILSEMAKRAKESREK